MENKANAFREEAEIGGLTPDEEVKRDVEELAPFVAGISTIRDPDVGLLSEVGAPGVVVTEELLAELAQNPGVEGVDVVRGRREAHLCIGEVEDEVLPLVPDVVLLEAEEEGQPVEEVHMRGPLAVRRLAEFPHSSERSSDGADLREAEGGVVGEEVVDGDDVVGFRFGEWSRNGLVLGRRGPPETHGIGGNQKW